VPRKKTETAAAEPSILFQGACPACKSDITLARDGKTLHEKSSYLDELIETDASVDEVEKKIEKMQKALVAHEATIADLRAQLEAENKKPPQEKEKPSVLPEKQKGREATGGKPASWWD
jgi:phage shock protein A